MWPTRSVPRIPKWWERSVGLMWCCIRAASTFEPASTPSTRFRPDIFHKIIFFTTWCLLRMTAIDLEYFLINFCDEVDKKGGVTMPWARFESLSLACAPQNIAVICMYMLPSSTCRFLVCRFLHLVLRLNTAKIMAGWNNFTVDPAGYLPAFHSEKRLNKLLIYIYKMKSVPC